MYILTASGQKLTNGHIFRNDTIIGTGVDTLLNSIYCAFHLSSLNGAEFCDNVMDSSYHGMHFVNINNVALRSNHFANHSFGLKIEGDTTAQIGIQLERGNQWDSDPDACVKFAAQVKGGNPLKSRFVVQDDVLPWLPDHDRIDPDPDGFGNPDWFNDGGTDMDAGCISPLLLLERTLTPAEIEVVMDTSTLSGTNLWDWKREVYTKLLIYPDLRPSSSSEETFFNSFDRTTIDSFGHVTEQMRDALSLSSGDQTDLDTYRTAIEAAFEDLAALDESLDYSDLANLTGGWFSDRETLLELIASNAADEATLESTRNPIVFAALEDAAEYNKAITTPHPYEAARKTINELHLSRLLALPMTEALYEDALTLVEADEVDAGVATKEGIRFLSPCDQDLYLNSEENAQERGELQKSKNSTNERVLQVAPNPNSGFFEVSLTQDTGVLLMVYNVQGQKIKTLSVTPGKANIPLDLGLFPNGLYWIVLSDEEGKVLGTAKVSIAR